jgi:hypothetical protein
MEDSVMKKLFTSTIFIISIFLLAAPASASIIWGTDASGELIGSRDSIITPSGGITATDGWAGGNFELSWVITPVNSHWEYVYTVSTAQKEISHFILEVTEDGNPFNTFGDTDAFEGPKTWSEGSGNPDMPNDIYGIKFDFGGSPVTYTIVTDREPVYGVFYAKDGRDDGDEVVAWSNALVSLTYRTDTGFSTNDFIVRPDSGSVVPVPGAVWLLGSGLIGLAGIRKKFKS